MERLRRLRLELERTKQLRVSLEKPADEEEFDRPQLTLIRGGLSETATEAPRR
jgi:hypothetical protein